MKTQTIAAAFALVIAAGAITYVIANMSSKAPDQNEHDGSPQNSAPVEVVKGPNGGRLLSEGDFQVEVTIFERGIPPEFRVYAYNNQEVIDPAKFNLTIELLRFGSQVDTIGFTPRDSYLLGDKEVVEPHSFDVDVKAQFEGTSYAWRYDSYEGRTEISQDAAQTSGIVIDTVSSAQIQSTLKFYGTITPNAETVKPITPRYPGVVKEIRKQLGDAVSKGEVLAIVENTDSLQSYELASGQAGHVVWKDVTAGEFVEQGADLYVVADFSTVWVDLKIYRNDFHRIRLGQAVTIDGGEGIGEAHGTIDYVSPIGSAGSQTMLARVVLPNPNGIWRPGLNVTGTVIVDEFTVPVAVKESALQTFRDWDVVFLNDGRLYEIAILELGRRDGQWVEVLSGLKPGQSYVSENSFLIKADVLKSGASHDH